MKLAMLSFERCNVGFEGVLDLHVQGAMLQIGKIPNLLEQIIG